MEVFILVAIKTKSLLIQGSGGSSETDDPTSPAK